MGVLIPKEVRARVKIIFSWACADLKCKGGGEETLVGVTLKGSVMQTTIPRCEFCGVLKQLRGKRKVVPL